MKKSFTVFAGAVMLNTVLPAVAGPNFELIEQGRKIARADAPKQADANRSARLDHGPHAQTVPYLNQAARTQPEVAAAVSQPKVVAADGSHGG